MAHVLHILPDMRIGGRERMVAALLRDLPGQGIATSAATLDPVADDAACVPCAPLPVRVPADVLAGHGATLGADIWHIHGANLAARLFAEGAVPPGVATVLTLHMGMEKSWRWLSAIRRALRRVDRLVAVSEPLARLYGRIGGRGVNIIRPAADVAARERRAATPATLRFAMLSRLHPVKGHITALAAMDRLIAEGRVAELHVAGEGPLAPMLCSAAAARPWLHLHGAVADPGAFLADVDILLHPSLREGSPLAVMEAMATGLPVIASAVGGVPDLISDAGVLVPPRRPRLLTAAMVRLADDPELCGDLGRRAGARAMDWHPERQAAAYTREYDALRRLRGIAAAA